ncbi:hypothetical protein HOY82DRAFT_265254 [Tuber indicum]|nr:hypothetical protein HOY82DRAFT_265254 [Tuber indicum]
MSVYLLWWGASLSFLLVLLSPSIISPTILLLPNPYPSPSLHCPVVCSVCGICCIPACLYRGRVKLECVVSHPRSLSPAYTPPFPSPSSLLTPDPHCFPSSAIPSLSVLILPSASIPSAFTFASLPIELPPPPPTTTNLRAQLSPLLIR